MADRCIPGSYAIAVPFSTHFPEGPMASTLHLRLSGQFIETVPEMLWWETDGRRMPAI
jgi:hypothetical protein